MSASNPQPLNTRLREILLGPTSTDEAVQLIHKAFTDEGYVQLGRIKDSKDLAHAVQTPGAYVLPGYMTGAEWLARFKKIVEEDTEHFKADPSVTADQLPSVITAKVLGAARKAAGVDNG